MFPAIANAGVSKISGPLADEGMFTAKHYATHTEDDRPARNSNETYRAAYEYDFAKEWVGEIGFGADDRYHEDLNLKSISLEALRTLTRQSDGWLLSTGFVGGYIINTDHGANKISGKFRTQYETDQIRLRFNILLERQIGGGDNEELGVGTNASALYKLSAHFKPGIEWHTDWRALSAAKHSNAQKHWLGPALYGDLLTLANGDKIEYQAAYVFGLTNAAEDGVAILGFDYKIMF